MTLTSELRDAWRGLRGGKGTTIFAFVVLALTITAATVVFSIVDGVALRRLPFASPDSLVAIGRVSPTGTMTPAPSQDYFSWQSGVTTTIESMGASRPGGQWRLAGDDLETLIGATVTASLFDVLGVRAFAGRLFSADHEQPGHDDVVVLSHRAWMRRFGGDLDAIGRHVTLVNEFRRDERVVRRIIGVLPPDVTYPMAPTPAPDPDLFVPYIASANDRNHAFPGRVSAMSTVGRLRPGVSIDQARAEIEHVSATFKVSAAEVRVVPLHERIVGPAKKWLFLALAAVGLVLLVACVNVAGLLLSRATIRLRELATREALGASRARLARGFLLEGLLLSLAAAAVAAVLSSWGVELAISLLPDLLARTAAVRVDARVLSISVMVSIACGLTFASAPAWLASRGNLIALTKSGGGVIGGARSNRTLSSLLVAELAVVSLLLVATTLVVTSFVRVTTADLGFDRRNVMNLWFQQSLNDVADAQRPAAVAALRADLLARANAVAGVTHAALSTGTMPLSGGGARYGLVIPGYGEARGDEALETRMVTPEYFDAMGMQLIRGRSFGPSDVAGAPAVMLINDVAARKFFQGRDPIGEVVEFRGPTTIVGVLRSVRVRGPEVDAPSEMYIPLDQDPHRYFDAPQLGGALTTGGLIVRTNGDARRLAPAIQDAIRPAIGGEPARVSFVEDDFWRVTTERRFNASVMALFGLVATAIGAIGIYGTMAFFVAQQVRAIGLRIALGASPAHVMRTVIGHAAWRVAAGVAIGLAAAWAMANTFASFVFGVTPTAPGVYVMVASVVAIVGLAAALAPARRAARVDPLVALRSE